MVEDRQWAKPPRPPPREYRRNRADFGDSDDADRTGVWTLSRPSLARVAGYDLMDGGDDLINAVRHGRHCISLGATSA